MRRAFIHSLKGCTKSKQSTLARFFARQIKPVQKKFDLDKLVINEKAVVYKQEINANRDFFYQEMIDLPSVGDLLNFYEAKKDQMDGLGIKILIEELLKRLSGGKLPKRKLLKCLIDSKEGIKYKDVIRIADHHSREMFTNLENSHFVDLVELFSKLGLISEQFTIVVIKRLLLNSEFSSTQWTYDFLLHCINQDHDAYLIVLEMLEDDLTTKRVEITDPIVALALLERVISFRDQKMKLVRQLEYYLDLTTKGKLTEESARYLLAIYANNGFRSANLELLDKVAATLIPEVYKKDIVYLQSLLKDMSDCGLEDFTLLSAISRKMFDLLSDKAVALQKLTDETRENQLSEGEDDEIESKNEDEESLEAITAKVFGSSHKEIPIEGQNHTSSEKDLMLEDETVWLPQMLYHFVRLNVGQSH